MKNFGMTNRRHQYILGSDQLENGPVQKDPGEEQAEHESVMHPHSKKAQLH